MKNKENQKSLIEILSGLLTVFASVWVSQYIDINSIGEIIIPLCYTIFPLIMELLKIIYIGILIPIINTLKGNLLNVDDTNIANLFKSIISIWYL